MDVTAREEIWIGEEQGKKMKESGKLQVGWRAVGGGVGLIYEVRRHRGRVFFNLSAVVIIGFSSRVNDKVRAGSIQTAEPIRAASPVLLLSPFSLFSVSHLCCFTLRQIDAITLLHQLDCYNDCFF